MKVRILNNACYFGLPLDYPFEVNAEEISDFLCGVLGEELIAAGACPDRFDSEYLYSFVLGEEAEVVVEEEVE